MALKEDLQKLVNEKNERIETVPEELTPKVQRTQRALFEQITILINSLETESGNLIISEQNLILIEQIINDLRAFLPTTGYNEALTIFAREFNIQGAINDD